MANEVIELPRNEQSGYFPVTQEGVDALRRQRELLKAFVKSALREGIDYGVVPGTDKPSLFKPGAEKLARVFKLGCRTVSTDKTLDRKDNFAMFTYRAEIYSLDNSGVVIADCEGSCNSQEKKYKDRAVYEKVQGQQNRVYRGREDTPVCDVLNTLMKMAQKRAVVGAVILAVAASDFFTQDIDDPTDAEQLGVGQRTPVQPTQASIPTVIGARSGDQSVSATCDQCNGAMMISKYPNKQTGAIDWYCSKCKVSKPRE